MSNREFKRSDLREDSATPYYKIKNDAVEKLHEVAAQTQVLIQKKLEKNSFYRAMQQEEIQKNETSIPDGYDLGELDCLSEDDLFKETWLVAGMDFPNHIEYFWEAEIADLCQTERGDFFTILRDSVSEPEDDNYSKYLCYVNDSGGFNYCGKDDCEGCTKSCKRKVLNPLYILWQKFVQPVESEI